MRGRGFTIRQPTQSSGGGGSSGGSSNIGSGVSSGTGGSSLLGVGVATSSSVSGRTDVFRSRPQNTSRPPSLHVDDFNKLEKDEGSACSGAAHEVVVDRAFIYCTFMNFGKLIMFSSTTTRTSSYFRT